MNASQLRNIRSSLLAVCVVVITSACGGGGSSGGSNPDNTPITDFSAGNDLTVENINVVVANLQPGSLAPTNGNPCDGTVTFIDCQPNLLKVYLNIVKQAVEVIAPTVSGLSATLASTSIKSGVTGSINDTTNNLTIYYNIVSANRYQILIKNDQDMPMAYLDVDASDINFIGDLLLLSESQDSGTLDISIHYIDQDTFDIDVALVDANCDPLDVYAPQNIEIKLQQSFGVVKGKAMVYMPRWVSKTNAENSVTCSMSPSPDTKMALYTDFVGDDISTTAAVYLMPTTVSDVATMADYPLSAICSNFSNWCDANGFGFGDPNPLDTYGNDFCVTSTTLSWNAPCDSTELDISTPIYSDSSNWIVPMDFAELSLSLPGSL